MRIAIGSGSANACARSVAALSLARAGMTDISSRIQSRTIIAIPCEAQKRIASIVDDAAPSGHDDRGRHARARIVSKSPSAIADKERAAPDGKVRVVGFRRYDARLDREPSLPKGVAFRVGGRVGYKLADGRSCPVAAFRWFSERCLPQAQQSLPRRPGIRPRSYFGIGAIDSRAGRARIEPRQRRRNVDRIATSPPHKAKLSRAARRVIPLTPMEPRRAARRIPRLSRRIRPASGDRGPASRPSRKRSGPTPHSEPPMRAIRLVIEASGSYCRLSHLPRGHMALSFAVL